MEVRRGVAYTAQLRDLERILICKNLDWIGESAFEQMLDAAISRDQGASWVRSVDNGCLPRQSLIENEGTLRITEIVEF